MESFLDPQKFEKGLRQAIELGSLYLILLLKNKKIKCK